MPLKVNAPRSRLLPGLIIALLIMAISMVVWLDSAPAQARETNGKVSMDFDHVDIKVFIKFMSKLTGRNFVIDDKVQGTVTILSPTPVSVDEAYKIFQSVLEVKGYTTVRSGKVTKIVRTVESRQKSVPTRSRLEYQPKADDEVITQIIPLDHASSAQLRKILTPMVSKQGLLVAYDPTDTLILTDYASNVQRLLKIVEEIDVKSFKGDIRLAHLTHATASQLADKLTQLLGAGREGQEQLKSGEIKLVPEERTNSLIILAKPDTMQQILQLVEQIDQPTPEDLSNIQVVSLENAQAEELAKVLSNLAGQQGSEKGASLISKNVSIVADKPSNSLVIIAEPSELETLMPIIEKLDSPRKQVYVEAAIIEVSADSTLSFGVNWQGAEDFEGGEGAIFGSSEGVVQSATDLAEQLAANPSGLSFGVLSFPFTFQGEEFFSLGAFLKASQQDNSVQIISTPQLMTMENEEATVIIAENRPFVTSREVSENDREFNNIEYKDVGVTLKVTPLINNQGWVKLNIYQEVSRIDPNVAFDTETPITRKRTAETTVMVKDTQTVVIAGLMEKKTTNNESKIPLLGDMPLLGSLFKTNTDIDEKTNLMVFITPRVVQAPEDAGAIAYSKSRKLNELRYNLKGQIEAIPDGFIPFQPVP